MARFVPVEEEGPRFAPREEAEQGARPDDEREASRFRFGAPTRAEAAATGGTFGAILGAPAGPIGMVAGGGIGAAIGSTTFDSVNNILAMMEGRDEDVRGAGEVAREGLREGGIDVAFGLTGALAQPLRLVRAGLGRISGVTSEAARDLAEKARHFGVQLGAVDVGTSLPKTYARSVGVFPITGTPLRTGQISKIEEANRAINRTLDAFAPNERIAADIGMDMVEAARASRQEFRSVAGSMYDNVRVAIDNAQRSDIIPTNVLKEYAEQVVETARRGEIVLADGGTLPPTQRQEVAEFMERYTQLPDLITPDQFKRLSDDLSDLISKNIRDGFDVKQLADAKIALREGFNSMRVDLLPEGQGRAIQDSLEAANTFYAKGIVQFQTRAAQPFERVDKMIFRAGAPEPGSLNADELYRVAINLRSPQQIKDLTKLVGARNIKNAARRNFQDAVDLSRRDIELMGQNYSVVNPEKLERALGLSGARGQSLEGMREFYRTAGVDLEQVQTLISVMKRIEGIGNPAEFVRRRVILGGAAAATGALGVGGAVAVGDLQGGAVTAVAMTLFARHFSRVMADPRKLKSMTEALDEALDMAPRRAQLGRVLKLIMDEEDVEAEMESLVN